MTHHHIKVGIEGLVASLAFNRPNVLNAFHNEAMDECVAALKELGDDQRVRAIVVRGEGRAFSAGFDMKDQLASGLPPTAWPICCVELHEVECVTDR
jgi:enoyl-CoA hydratase